MEALAPPAQIRILLAARDGRFLRVSGFLLTRDGFAVETTREPREVLELVERHDPNVVVLDGSDSLAVAARTVAAMEARHPNVGVLVVAEDRELPPRSPLHVLPKWGSCDRLAGEVQRVHVRGSTRRHVALAESAGL